MSSGAVNMSGGHRPVNRWSITRLLAGSVSTWCPRSTGAFQRGGHQLSQGIIHAATHYCGNREFLKRCSVSPPVVAAPGLAPRNATDSPRQVIVTGDAQVGKGLFDKHCVTCHGPGGKGDGLEIVEAEVADLTSAATRAS